MHIHRRCYLYIYLSKIFVRKLILFLVTCGLFLLLLGLGLILLYSCHQDQHTIVRPLIVIGEQLFWHRFFVLELWMKLSLWPWVHVSDCLNCPTLSLTSNFYFLIFSWFSRPNIQISNPNKISPQVQCSSEPAYSRWCFPLRYVSGTRVPLSVLCALLIESVYESLRDRQL